MSESEDVKEALREADPSLARDCPEARAVLHMLTAQSAILKALFELGEPRGLELVRHAILELEGAVQELSQGG